MSGLNLKEVLDAHPAWKVKDAECSDAAEDKLDVVFITNDCHCVMVSSPLYMIQSLGSLPD
ncbi:hypothetical protein MNBD_GAMMA12-1466 [hydrothermal vent metagenome]|uniref:Uncharacterized protein n=1 Tax=hydrothermal vent metagenome TaxID=652676 RepID=A0A3B0YDE0_9ZZZZ